MFENKQLDFLAIGDITTDAFIRLRDASVHCDLDKKNCQICMNFASKVPYEFVEVVHGVGNSANAAVSASRLGLSSAIIGIVGGDEHGKLCRDTLSKDSVDTKLVTIQKDRATNYHYVLWYEDERTILVKHEDYDYRLPKYDEPRWIYLSSLGPGTTRFLKDAATYIKKHPLVKLCFQPGTFQLSLGMSEIILPFYEHAEVFVVNVEEAEKILGATEDIKTLLKALHALGPKIILITDGPKGAYMLYDDTYWFMPIYPDPKPPYERTGAGDSFAATFVSALALGKTPEEALVWAPINPMSVVQYIGAQKGLLKRAELEHLLQNAPAKYRPEEI